MNAEFWQEAKSLKRKFILLWLGFIPIGMFSYYFLYLIFQEEPKYSIFLALFIWGYFWRKAKVNFMALHCPNCKELAFENSTAIFTKMKCKYCGLSEYTPNKPLKQDK